MASAGFATDRWMPEAISAAPCVSIELPWYIGRTDQGAEISAARMLAREFDVATFVPLCIRDRRAIKKRPLIQPFLTGYILLRFDAVRDPYWLYPRADFGLRSFLGRGPWEPAIIPPKQIEALQALGRAKDGVIDLDALGREDLTEIEPGARVLILQGPFVGQGGICKMSEADRVIASLKFLGVDRDVEFRRDQVRVA